MLFSSAVALVIAFLAYNYSQSSRLPRTTSWWIDTLKPPIRNVTKAGALNRLMFSLRQLRATTSTNHEPRWRWTRRQKTTFAFRTVSDLNENWADKRSLGRWLYPSVYPYPPTAAATHPTLYIVRVFAVSPLCIHGAWWLEFAFDQPPYPYALCMGVEQWLPTFSYWRPPLSVYQYLVPSR